jgi:methylmalonyl-CoA mutase N-terminal domain/subunit
MEALTDTVEAEALALIAEIDTMAGGPWTKDRITALSVPTDAVTAPPKSPKRERGASSPPSSTSSSFYSGGVIAGIHKGYFRRQIAEASYRYSEECENHDRIIVGVNEYTDESEQRPIDILTIPDSVETEQVALLQAFKARRDPSAVNAALDTIRESARNNANVMPALVEGALANCTLGEMVQAMADIYGRYTGGPEW